ncbi:MAG: 4-(cytidine 5'-diphospho)-2-C-methyl-D-erythritol kinase [Bacteroidota bacterium]
MVCFPNCKINLGLNITEKRTDGFHNIETVFYPLNWCDSLELIENRKNDKAFEFSTSGLSIKGSLESNLIYKAFQLIKSKHHLPNLVVHLHKTIPMGAGLGGGSADAAFFIRQVNQQFHLLISEGEQVEIANQLGSDCAFFIQNKPVYAYDKGNLFDNIALDLNRYCILVIYPGIHSNTKEAYDGVLPKTSQLSPKQIIEQYKIHDWKQHLKNDFEKSIFKKYPQIEKIKNQLYADGAIYASLSGSGSAVYGIFESAPALMPYKQFDYFLQSAKEIDL